MDARVEDFALSSDGKQVATARGMFTTANVSLVELANGKTEALPLSAGERVEAFRVAISPDRTHLAVGTWQDVRVIDLRKKATLKAFPIPGVCVSALVFSRDSRFLYAGSRAVHRIDLRTGDLENVFSETEGTLRSHPSLDPVIYALAISPDGGTMAIGLFKGVILWDLVGARQIHALPCQSAPGNRVDFSPDGKLLATGGDTVELWECQTGKRLTILEHQLEYNHFPTLAFSADQTLLVAGGSVGRSVGSYVLVWRMSDRKHLATLLCHRDSLTQLAFFPGTHKLITGSRDKTLQIWDLDKYLPSP